MLHGKPGSQCKYEINGSVLVLTCSSATNAIASHFCSHLYVRSPLFRITSIWMRTKHTLSYAALHFNLSEQALPCKTISIPQHSLHTHTQTLSIIHTTFIIFPVCSQCELALPSVDMYNLSNINSYTSFMCVPALPLKPIVTARVVTFLCSQAFVCPSRGVQLIRVMHSCGSKIWCIVHSHFPLV